MHRLFSYRTFSTVPELDWMVTTANASCRKMYLVNQETIMNLVVTSSLLLSGSSVSNS